jgi:hypothetical protein
MKATEILNEVFDSNVPGKVVKKTASSFITKATIGNRDIKFQAAGHAGDWEVDFIEQSPKRGDTFGKSGSGNELQVFSFVIESLELFISLYSPAQVMFTSDKSDTNRTKLYKRMSKRVKIPGYHIEIADRGSAGYDIFKIIRDQ